MISPMLRKVIILKTFFGMNFNKTKLIIFSSKFKMLGYISVRKNMKLIISNIVKKYVRKIT